MTSMPYALKLMYTSKLVVVSWYDVPMFIHLNHSVFSTRNGLVIKDQVCALGVTLGALVLRITKCVHGDKETMGFLSCVFQKQLRYHMHLITPDLYKCALLRET